MSLIVGLVRLFWLDDLARLIWWDGLAGLS